MPKSLTKEQAHYLALAFTNHGVAQEKFNESVQAAVGGNADKQSEMLKEYDTWCKLRDQRLRDGGLPTMEELDKLSKAYVAQQK